jgi:hypothetical protein
VISASAAGFSADAEAVITWLQLPRSAGTGGMVRVSIDGHPLTATAALVWSRDLSRPLQQILFDTAEGAAPPAPASLPRAS